MIHFTLLLAVWVTIHFNKQVSMELLSAYVNEKVHLSLFFTVITFYLFLKASWISAHCSIGNHICFIQSDILIFRFWADISVIHFTLPFCFGFAECNFCHFFFLILCLLEITLTMKSLSFSLLLFTSHCNSQKTSLGHKENGNFVRRIFAVKCFYFHAWLPWDFTEWFILWTKKRNIRSQMN